MTKSNAWLKFSKQVYYHIKQTEEGHYSQGGIDVIDFIESQFQIDATLAWAKDVIKYVIRQPHTANQIDLLKAAHYLCRIWLLNENRNERTNDETISTRYDCQDHAFKHEYFDPKSQTYKPF